jgi:two-component system, NtrC family, sensor kinase
MPGVRQQDQGLVGETAANLPWICPNADVLTQLAQDPFPLEKLALEPSIVLLAARFVRPTFDRDLFCPNSLRESVVAEAASKLLESHSRYFLSGHPFVQELLEISRNIANCCRKHAQKLGTVSPDAASAVGLLAPLGWLALATVNPADAAEVREQCIGQRQPDVVQRKAWGLSHEEIARRLCQRWRLPNWLSGTLTTLSLNPSDAERLGADRELSNILRDAIRDGADSGLFSGQPRSSPTVTAAQTKDPRTVELLPILLRTVARVRRRDSERQLRMAEAEVDRLRGLISETRDQFEIAVRDAKLAGLAELAAGAAHEINNPLAVIAGNAQRLAKTESDSERKKSLELIQRHSVRISEILRELMHYARPTSPVRATVNVTELVREAVSACELQLGPKRLRIVGLENGPPIWLDLDPGHLRKAVDQILLNAIEASPTDSAITVLVQSTAAEVCIAIEDSGPGPRDDAIPHLFDPFFSGRTAGRGRGLGLPIAWRLASLNGGEVRFCPRSTGPTRFELVFERGEPLAPPKRKSA